MSPETVIPGKEDIKLPDFVIKRPDDPEWIKLLEQKARQYARWREQQTKATTSPESIRQHPAKRQKQVDATQRGCAMVILNEVLNSAGGVNIFDIGVRLIKRLGLPEDGGFFNKCEFEKACEVVFRYTVSKDFLRDSVQSSASRENQPAS